MSEEYGVVLAIFVLFALVGGAYWYRDKKKRKKPASGGGGGGGGLLDKDRPTMDEK